METERVFRDGKGGSFDTARCRRYEIVCETIAKQLSSASTGEKREHDARKLYGIHDYNYKDEYL